MNKPLMLALGVLLLAGCGKPETATPAAASASPTETAPAAVASDAATAAAPVVDATAATDGATTESAASDAAATPAATVGTSAPAAAAATPVATATSSSTSATAASAAAKPAAPAASTAVAAVPVPAPAKAATSVASSAGGDPGTLVRAETLRARPAADAPEAGSLTAGTAVKVISREGGWYQISANGQSGWVRMLSVRRSEPASTSVAGIAGIASGRTGTGKVVTTTGVRGLDSEELQAAVFDEVRIAKAETLRVSRQDAEAFARQGGLVKQDVPALPAPTK